jgi:HD-like signal output (HDOD) protein
VGWNFTGDDFAEHAGLGHLVILTREAVKEPCALADKEQVTSIASPISYKQRALKSLSSLPPLSPVLNHLLASLAKDNISFAQLAALIEKDTVLAGNVLRMVNSALFGCSGTINSVSHAIAIMGLVKLRNTALGFSVNRMWKSVRTPRGWSMARFNLHSVGTAMMADLIAQRLPVEYAEGAFVSGLFHDLGKLLIAVALVDEYENISRLALAQSAGEERTLEECEAEVIGVNHCQLSAAALETWHLPAPICTAVLYHHDPDAASREAFGGYRFHLGHIVRAADETMKDLDITSDAARKDHVPPAEHRALIDLGLGDKIPKIMDDFRPEFDAIRLLV